MFRTRAALLARAAAIVAAVVALSGCDALSDILSVDGQVIDTNGKPVEGATVRIYKFLDNLEYFGLPEEKVDITNPDTFKVRVDVGTLQRTGVVASTVKTDKDGKYVAEGIGLDVAVIALASRESYSTDIKGMNLEDGTVSLSSALFPGSSAEGGPLGISAKFVLSGPPDGDSDVLPDDETDEEEIVPPSASDWVSFWIEDEEGNVLADARSGNASLPDAGGKNVRIFGEHGDTSLQQAFIRVQMGSGDCDGHPPKVHQVAVRLVDGKITSDRGDYQPWYLSGGFESYQLDTDDKADNGSESYTISSDAAACDLASPLVITLTWSSDLVDLSLHIWDDQEEHTYQGSWYEDLTGASSYGRVVLDDREGYGPEIFTLNPDKSGAYSVKIETFCGPQIDTTAHVRVVRWFQGEWHDESFTAPVDIPEWIEVGTFHVDPLP